MTALGSYWKGRKPLILVRAVVLGLLLPASNDPERDRDIFLKLMLMDDAGLLKRKKRFDRDDVPRVMELLPEKLWSSAIALTNKGYNWVRGSTSREDVEAEAFAKMGLDEKLRHCLRPEELPETALDRSQPDCLPLDLGGVEHRRRDDRDAREDRGSAERHCGCRRCRDRQARV